MKIKKDIANKNGFTLIELLVALTIFSVVITVVADIFIAGIGGTRRLFGSQAVQESGRFIMESMSKEIRMSSIISVDGVLFENLDDDFQDPFTNLIVKNEAGNIAYVIDNDAKTVSRASEVLNSDKVEATGAFYLVKNGDAQPRIIITLGLKNKSAKVAEQAEIHLQTTVSSREYAQ